jgi:hypothetical protein
MPVFCDYVHHCVSTPTPTSGSVPIGSVVAYTKNTTGFPHLKMDGATWNICDGENNTVDLRERFIYGNGINPTNLHTTGGSAGPYILKDIDIPPHSHTVPPLDITKIQVTGTAAGETDGPNNTCNHKHGPPPGSSSYVTEASTGIDIRAAQPANINIDLSTNTGDVVDPNNNDLKTHKHSFSGAVVKGHATGSTDQGATLPQQPPQTGSVPTIPPYMKLYYIERTA